MTPSVHVLGIRHHGPGSARAVRAALANLQPDCVLIEGPAELNGVLPFAASSQMRPPVAGFVYLNDEPKHATFDPFASFSPEWIALRYAFDNDRVVRFIDLPAADRLSRNSSSGDVDEESEAWSAPSVDPIAALPELAGYEDAEAWWEDVIEHRLANEPRKSSESSATRWPNCEPRTTSPIRTTTDARQQCARPYAPRRKNRSRPSPLFAVRGMRPCWNRLAFPRSRPTPSGCED